MTSNALAIHVLNALATAQRQGTPVTLDTLAAKVPVRRADVRRTVSELHRAGLVDAMRMRVTLSGFAAGFALPLPPLRREDRYIASVA